MKVKHKKHGWESEVKNPEQLIEMKDGEEWKLSNLEILNSEINDVENSK